MVRKITFQIIESNINFNFRFFLANATFRNLIPFFLLKKIIRFNYLKFQYISNKKLNYTQLTDIFCTSKVLKFLFVHYSDDDMST